MKALREEMNARLDQIARNVSHDESVPLDTLRAILAEMGEAVQGADAGEVERSLKAKAAEFKALTERLNRLSNDDPEVTRLRRTAAEALTGGRFVEADGHLAAAEARDLAGLDDLEALARQKRLSAAESRAERAAAAMLRTNPDAYGEAAAHYAEAARIAAPADESTSRSYAQRRGLALILLGDEFGQNVALQEAIKQFRSLLHSADRARDQLNWAKTQEYLGNVLQILGQREGDKARLEEAVSAYRAALEEENCERTPFDWARMQTNLGTALARLGEREGGADRLEAAVSAYEAVLVVWTQERVPLDWAMTQNNLGVVLQTLGQRESRTDRLEAAVSAYRAALEEWTRERVPLDWAGTQNNLGNALSMLAQRESGMGRLEEAVSAYRAALEEWTRERVPLQWAMTQYNLGNALKQLGQRESGTDRLEDAVSVYRVALEEQTQERVPLEWAKSVGNQGVAIGLIAERRDDIALARTALEQIQTARDTFEAVNYAPAAAHYAEQAELLEAQIRRMGSD